MKPPLRQGSANDFQTPKRALIPLLPFLKKDWCMWECAAGKGNLVKGLRDEGFLVIASDIIPDGSSGIILRNFLEWSPDKFDCIVTNPPFSLKDDFIERAYSLGKPFAFLLPLTTFEGKKRQALFQMYGLEVIFFDKRINFETPSGKDGGSWFMTAWFTWGLNIGKQL